MRKTFFSADHHLGHANIIDYCHRPFSSVEQMDDEIIRRHNERVGLGDDVYIIGDFTLGSLTQAQNYLRRMNGQMHVLCGSHDQWIPKHVTGVLQFTGPLVVIEPPLLEVKTPRRGGNNRNYIALCHYAMLRWPRSHHGSFHLFGHSHGRLQHPLPRAMDVGVDCHDFYPISMEEVMDRLAPKGDPS